MPYPLCYDAPQFGKIKILNSQKAMVQLFKIFLFLNFLLKQMPFFHLTFLNSTKKQLLKRTQSFDQFKTGVSIKEKWMYAL